MIRRRLQRTQKVFKRVKNPSPVVMKVYKKKVRALKQVMHRLTISGRKSCNVRKNVSDVKKSSATIAKSLQKVLELTKKASTQSKADAAKTQKQIADLLKRNIKDSKAISEKMNKSENCGCQNCGKCDK